MKPDHYQNAINKGIKTDQDMYDAIMAEGYRVMLRHRDVGDAYYMHKAFEWMLRECKEGLDNFEQLTGGK